MGYAPLVDINLKVVPQVIVALITMRNIEIHVLSHSLVYFHWKLSLFTVGYPHWLQLKIVCQIPEKDEVQLLLIFLSLLINELQLMMVSSLT